MQPLPPHTASLDHVVGRLLQLWRADCPITLSDKPSSVMAELLYDKEETEGRLNHAAKPPAPAHNSIDLQQKLSVIIEYLEIGKRLEAQLTGAVEACRQGKATGPLTIVLRVEENDPYQHQEGYFTTTSAYDWARDEFDIAVPEWAPAQRSSEANPAQNQRPDAAPSKYTELDRDKHEVIIALLLDELAANLGGKYVENGQPNFTQLGERIAAKCADDKVSITGLSKEMLRKKFSNAKKVKKRYTTSRK